MKEKLQFIAETYGYETQSRQLVEEMAELTVAINKYWRALHTKYCGVSRRKTMMESRNCLIEEIADVEVMLEQIKYILWCEGDVDRIKAAKIDRQIARIKEAKGGRGHEGERIS